VLVADQPAGEAAIEPERQHVHHRVRRLTGSDVAEARDQGRADDIIIAQDRRTGRQLADDAAKLSAVQHLPVRQVHVGDAELAEVENLADPMHQGAGGQRDHARRCRPRLRAPHGQPVDPARQWRPGVVAADPVQQEADRPGRLLHQQQVGLFLRDQGSHVVDGRAGAPQEVPAHDLERSVRPVRLGGRWQGDGADRACSWGHRTGLVPHCAASPLPPRSNAPGAGTFDGIRAVSTAS